MAINAPRRSAATVLAASMLFVLLAAAPALATGIRLSRSIGPPTSTTTVSGLVSGTPATGLSAFDEATGTLQWESGVQTDGYAAPEVSKGVIFAGAAGGMVAIDARTGVVRWTGGTIGLITSASPVVWGGS